MPNNKGNGYDAVEVVRTAITLCTTKCGWSLEAFCLHAGTFVNAKRFDAKRATEKIERFLDSPETNFGQVPSPILALSNWAVMREPSQIQEKFNRPR